MKISFDSELIGYAFADLSDKQRLELIKVLINSAPDAQNFQQKLIKEVPKMDID